MDKYEYKVRADEIKSLIEEGEFAEAVKIADTIDWRRVRSVMMLCTVSDLYKINRRYQESKDILLLANEKRPSGRAIVYSLCELSIKMDELIDAIKYYNEFVEIAPRDTGKYVLLYRLYEAQDVSLEERIAVLEEFKKRDYREKWAYELAYLYHRIGLTTKCIEECDEMYLWFGEGKYVLKALELKSLHVPLNSEQQEKYDTWLRQRDEDIALENKEARESEAEEADEQQDASYTAEETDSDNKKSDTDVLSMPTTELPEVKPVDVGQYNTINLQMVVAEGLKEVMPEESEEAEEHQPLEEEELPEIQELQLSDAEETSEVQSEEADMPEPEEFQSADELNMPEFESQEELSNYGEEPAEPQLELLSEEEVQKEISITEKLIAPLLQETAELPDVTSEIHSEKPKLLDAQPEMPYAAPEVPSIKPNAQEYVGQTRYDDVLSQEYDGQIRLVVPEEKVVEKQITGQLSIEDIMAEWEETKRNNEQKRMEDVRRRIISRTGNLFSDFDEATRNGLLEELDRAFVAAMMQDADKTSIKKVVYPSGIESELNDDIKAQLQQVVDDAASEAASILSQDADDEVEELEEIEDTENAEQEIEEPVAEEPAAVESYQQRILHTYREPTEEERELFGRYAQHKKSKEQLVNILDNMSMAAYTGNVIITGEEDGATMSLAKNIIRAMQYSDSNFSGKVAKISAAALNKKDLAHTLNRLSSGALIIEKAADFNTETIAKLNKVLENENIGLLLIMEDTKKRINGLLEENLSLTSSFNLRIDIEPLDDEELVDYAKSYALENEYSIDEFGVLALHTRIADMQTSDHEVSVAEVRELVDNAILYANKKTPGHFFDILLAKRYDAEDMIILREKDFMHY